MVGGLQRSAEHELDVGGGRVRRPAGSVEVDVAYLRPHPTSGAPLVVLPGGPGLASAVPYKAHRRDAVRRDFDVLMMEHRGIGLSRTGTDGADLPVEQVTATQVVDDLAAVLDDAGLDNAVIYGSSYGTYLAQLFGLRHPERVAGMVLDSPMLSAVGDVPAIRAYRRDLFLHGSGPIAAATRGLLESGVVDDSEVGRVGQVTYEFAGARSTERLMRARLGGRARRLWDWIAQLGEGEASGSGTRFVIEPDLVEGITFGELGFGHEPDGLPFDPIEQFARADAVPFRGEPADLVAALPGFSWPLAVISGERDLRTPAPIAERIVELAPDAVLVPLRDTGHSALDTHRLAGLAAARAVAVGNHRLLPAIADQLAGLPRRGASRLLGSAIRARLAAELALRR